VRPAEPFRLVIRESASADRVLVAVRAAGEAFPEAEALAAAIFARHPEVAGVVRVRARAGRRGGSDVEPLAGSAWLQEQIDAVTFRIPAACFTQVNREWTTRLPALVRELAGDVRGARVVDLYGGIGVHGFALAAAGASEVTVCEADAEAVRCGREAARGAGVRALAFAHASAEEFVRDRWPSRNAVDLVVANPPRTGMSGDVARGLGERAAGRLVLVSCDPPTLGRDVGILVGSGYRLRRAIPVDLFPQTPHVETVALLQRSG
jgi:23S rRNA (uracil1939-C5)-methyltransferase